MIDSRLYYSNPINTECFVLSYLAVPNTTVTTEELGYSNSNYSCAAQLSEALKQGNS